MLMLSRKRHTSLTIGTHTLAILSVLVNGVDIDLDGKGRQYVRYNDTNVISDEISFVICRGKSPGQCKVGINAPRGVSILRDDAKRRTAA